MIVVDEVRKPVIDALMVWHMRVWRMNAHRFGHDLGQRPAATQQFVVNAAPAFLVAREETFFELVVEMGRFLTAILVRGGLRCHSFFTPRIAVIIERH
jgi:hypothetical protein